MKTYRIGLVGYGKIGRHWAQHLAASSRWQLACICDRDPKRLEAARQALPDVPTLDDASEALADPSLDAVCLATPSDARPPLLEAALAAGKHIIAEKPLAAQVAEEQRLLELIESSDRLVAVDLFNRNGWYHKEAHAFIASGQIGKLAIVRLCHMTAGILPDEPLPEGPTFHDCGMHYVDVARWYAASEFDQWHSQGLRMWGESQPWWISVHGTFRNGVAFEITQGFVYGQMAQTTVNNSSCECLGTRGLVRMSHDFQDCALEMYGVAQTVRKTAPYGGKNMDVMAEAFAQSLDAGRNLGLPTARDAVIASAVSQQMHDYAESHHPPAVGTWQELEEIARFKASRAKR